jgi:UDP-N-acetyl-D-glucosamine dehydrogenase
LQGKGATVSFYDTYAADLTSLDGAIHVSLDKEVLQASDCVIIATDHSNVNYEWVMAHAPLIVDTRNVAKHFSTGRAKVIKL